MSEKGSNRASTLPTTAKERKEYPIATGVLDYFPDAIAAIAQVSFRGNEQHNPGTPLHWDRSKSTDEADALIRHFLERGTLDSDGVRHSAKVAWRALALLQKEIEADIAWAVSGGEPDTKLEYRNDAYYRGTQRACNDIAPEYGYYCTLSCGHSGDHQAEDTEDKTRWPNLKSRSMAPRPGGAF